MADCIRCHKSIEDTPFCPYCGAKQERTPAKRKSGNGTGYAYKRGSTWTAIVTVGFHQEADGKIHRIRRSKGGFKTKKEALAYCQVLFQPHKQESNATLMDIFNQWLPGYTERVSPSTLAGYKSAFAWYKSIHYYRMRLLKTQDFQSCIDECPRGKRVKEDMRTIAGLLCKYAYNNDVIDKNYAVNLFTGKEKKGTRPAFTMAEVETIRQAIGVHPYADYVYFMIYTGYRPSELFLLRKSSYVDGFLIGGIKTAAGKDRIMPLSPKIKFILDAQLKNPSDYLFPRSNGSQMAEGYFREFCFKPLMRALNIEGRYPYSCRHTFANLLKNVYGSDTDKAALMGHSDISMTKYYQSRETDNLVSIIRSL